ncbi:MAG: tetratricopeptide repeat protein [Acidobacteriota bacterium]
MPRILALILYFAFICGAQQQLPPPPAEQAPPEEDETLQKPKEYSFNPIQAEKELKIGNYYFKKGSYKAAAGRFREAVNWNPGYAEAYLRLGEAQEKLKDKKAAAEAYAEFVKLAPEDKRAGAVRKKIGAKPK